MLPSELVKKDHGIMSSFSQWEMIEMKLVKYTQKAYFFLTEPTSSRLSFMWSWFMGLLVLLIAIFYVLATCDGPNHYTNRENSASYPDLPDQKTYDVIDIILWTPLFVDTFFRLLMVVATFSLNGAYEIADDLTADTFKKWLHLFDFLCVLPFILDIGIDASGSGVNQFFALTLRAFYLLSCSKILRVTKDMPSALAVRLALGKSMEHLVIPLFFFLVFNIFFGVVLYFLEPCYNLDVCAWKNLFEACFFSVVTMTTTGYGNQVPRFVPARGISTIIMLFGSLFMSMPLAIIGNEYENAWVELKERMRIDSLEKLVDVVHEKMDIESEQRDSDLGNKDKAIRSSQITEDDSNFLKRRRMLRKRLSRTCKSDIDATRMASESMMSPLIDSTENLVRVLVDLKRVLDASNKMNPSLLLLMCELKGWMAPVQWNIKQSMKELAGTDNIEEDTGIRKMSFYRPFDNGFVGATPGEQDSAHSTNPTAESIVSLNRVVPFGEGNIELPKKDKDANNDDERKVDTPDLNSDNDLEGGQRGDDTNNKSDEARPQGHSSSSSEPNSSATPPAKFFSAKRWKKNTVTPQKDQLTAKKEASLGNILQVSPAALAAGRRSIKRGHSFAIKMVRAAPDIANKGTAEDFSRKMERALDNPESFRTRLWLLLEFPRSSKGARTLQIFLLCMILLSVFMLYTQTVPTFGSYGESSDICGQVLRVYCPNKNNNTLDPGCFVHDLNGPTAAKLRYNCDEYDCFGYGYNFGAVDTNATCIDSQPFETAEELARRYHRPDFLVGRDEMHKIHDVCKRIECTHVDGEVNGNFLWIPVEIFISFCFTLEIVMRIFVADSLYHFFADFMNIFDILSVVPFYIDMVQYLNSTPLDFRILSSSPEPVLLVAMKSFKVFRLFKMTRHFSASKVLFETAHKALSQILGIVSLLLFIVLMFSLFLFEVEKGTPCFVGDFDCELPEANDHEYKIGQRVLINKVGDVSEFKTVLESLWFSVVTLTSVGYGDLTPITNLGQMISIILMLFGAIYLAMPLTVAAATFWSVHQAYVDVNKKKQLTKEKKLVSSKFCRKITQLETSFTNVTKMLQEFFDDIQSADTKDQRKGKFTLLQRCLQVESSLRSALRKHDGDIRRLSAFSISNKEQIANNNINNRKKS